MSSKSKRKTNWREKLADSKGLPKVVELSEKGAKHWGSDKVLVPAPFEVDEIMRAVPKGKLITIKEIRAKLFQKHGLEACPMTTGIFAWIAANAAQEAADDGETDTTPYWRTLKTGGIINPKYPGGVEAQIKLLEAEGHTIGTKGRKNIKHVVVDFEGKVV